MVSVQQHPASVDSKTFYFLALLLFVCQVTSYTADDYGFEDEPAYKYWFEKGKVELANALKATENFNERSARNIILFLGDGMGVSTVTASRIRRGQLNGDSGEENLLSFEKFPHIALTKTFSMDSQVTDSAAAGTSMMTGVKVNMGVLGCDSRVAKGNCSNYRRDTRLKTLLHRFIDEGRSTGIVTNSRITHATPASAYAQIPHREWEGDVDLPLSSSYSSGDGELMEEDLEKASAEDVETHPCKDIDDIAKQLVMNNPRIKVLMGGGRRYFLDNATTDPETGVVGKHHRRDGLNLVQEWKRDKWARHARAHYVWNKKQFEAVDSLKTDYLLGLFSPSHMPFEQEGERRKQPNLVEMTKKAIEILQKNRRGYFLVVEGARIDFGHHANSASTAISETLELDQAVATAVKMTSTGRAAKETLILVTADHSHAFSIQGYAPRGNDILGKSRPSPDLSSLDGLPYTTLGYTNGPAFGRSDLTNVDTASPDFHQESCIPLSTETHAGEDVSVYAKGPWAHLFHATHDQTYIYHVMEWAACVGRSKRFCRD
ncbi:alkaline phosphatase [Plakobranchus ocellatus]|uniref:Alkaline phosphatase n=1 Tax=Plakobranchus ocellatus TaxID=259542 RepID=A0AAV4DEB3_9GAST|nr:alkaline phosphatase [Plakobranchus ocellatus]